MNAVWSFLSSLALKLIGPILAYLKGRGDQEKQSLESNLEAMRDAKDIKRRVDTDPAYRQSVRDKFR